MDQIQELSGPIALVLSGLLSIFAAYGFYKAPKFVKLLKKIAKKVEVPEDE